MTERGDIVFKAKLAEQAERYDGKARVSQGVDCRMTGALFTLLLPAQGARRRR